MHITSGYSEKNKIKYCREVNMKIFKAQLIPLILVIMLTFLASGLSANPASPWDDLSMRQISGSNDAPGSFIITRNSPKAVNFDEVLIAAAEYLKGMQADVTEDNAGNGDPDDPDDPDDGGWDWVVTSPPHPFSHSVNSSPTNIYGATALGLYYAYLRTSDTSYFIALTDAANVMVANPGIWSAADIIFLMLYDDLAAIPTTLYADSAKAKFDARIASQGSATGLAEYIRDLRSGQGYPCGIIAWDIGQFVRGAAMLEEFYPSDPYDYAQAAIDMAEVLWQDSYNDNPGYFDIEDDAGWDPTYTNKNYWWYNLGITGLIDAFSLSGVHTDEISGLVTILLEGQYSSGAMSYCYGANTDDENWQSTGFAAMTLGRMDQTTYQQEINLMAFWLASTQDTSGGWRYYTSTNNHYPEVAGECMRGLYYSSPPETVWVDDDYTPTGGNDGHYWGYDAFATILEGIDAVNTGGTVHVEVGTYHNDITAGYWDGEIWVYTHRIDKTLTLLGAQADMDPAGSIDERPGGESILTRSDGLPYPIIAPDVVINGFMNGSTSANTGGRFIVGDDADNCDIKYCIIQNTPSSSSGHGIYVYPGALGTGISYNTIANTAWEGIRNDGNADITHNTIKDISSNKGIYLGSSSGGMVSDNIISNTFYEGIAAFGSSIIAGNEIFNCYHGIQIRGDGTNYTIENNDIHDNQYHGIEVPNYTDEIVAMITITGNFISNNPYCGVKVGGNTDGSNYHINNNAFSGNGIYGVESFTTAAVDASGNWWGDNTPALVSAEVSTNVDYTPWLDTGTDTDLGTPGFQGDFSTLWVDDNSPQSGTIGRIQEGVDMTSGSTVNVLDGTYGTPINIVDRAGVTIIGESQANTIYMPTSVLDWDVGGYGSSRHTAIRVAGSSDIAFQNMTIDLDLIKANNTSGLLYWNSSGEISDNLIQNNNVYDAGGGYYELTCYLRAPDFTDGARAHIDILNNTFLETGRLAVVTHDYVDVLIDGNEFDKIDEDFGYALEIGSMSTAIITNNVFRNFATWAASDFSVAAAIYVENSFTSHIVDPIAKPIIIENNDISFCQYGIYVGNSWPEGSAAAGNVDIDALIKNNNIYNASTSGSWSSGGLVVTDEGEDHGSSVTVLLDSNNINNNEDYGIYIYTNGNGDITATLTENEVIGHIIGVRVASFGKSKSQYDLSIHHNIFDNNTNAYDDVAGGYWDDGISVGNCWSDFEDNSGYPDSFIIIGNGNAVDRYPNADCGYLCDCNPGDANGITPINIFDITYIIQYLYKDGPSPIPYDTCSADPDCNCTVNIFDITFVINFLYRDGAEPCNCNDWVINCNWPPGKSSLAGDLAIESKFDVQKPVQIKAFR
jgi:parallel beta-helix repeat protein